MSAFEADRFSHSRTSPRRTSRIVGSLAPASEKFLNQFSALPGQNSAANLDFMIQLRVIQHLHDRTNRTGFGIIRSVDQAANPCVHHCSGAHGTRFNCSKEVALAQTMVTNVCSGFAQRDDLGMRRGIGIADIAVPPPADDLAVADYNGSHWNFSRFQRTLRRSQGFPHPEFVVQGCVPAGVIPRIVSVRLLLVSHV